MFRFMVGIYYLLRYEGGDVVPCDDMTGQRVPLVERSTELETARGQPGRHAAQIHPLSGSCAARPNCTACWSMSG
jgi:hypothetical protein